MSAKRKVSEHMTDSTNSSELSNDELPVVELLGKTVDGMNHEELTKFVQTIRSLRSLNQGLHAKLQKESKPPKAKKEPKAPKIDLDDYKNLV